MASCGCAIASFLVLTWPRSAGQPRTRVSTYGGESRSGTHSSARLSRSARGRFRFSGIDSASPRWGSPMDFELLTNAALREAESRQRRLDHRTPDAGRLAGGGFRRHQCSRLGVHADPEITILDARAVLRERVSGAFRRLNGVKPRIAHNAACGAGCAQEGAGLTLTCAQISGALE